MGTLYHLTLISPDQNSIVPNDLLKKQIDNLLLKINLQMSTYLPKSEISQFNQYNKTDWFPVSQDLSFVVSSAQQISQQTNGSFDITIAPLVDLWGFGAQTQLEIPTTMQIALVKELIGYKRLKIRLQPPALRKTNKFLRIDLSSIAKGFAVDKISEHLNKLGYKNFLIEIGGEIRNQGFNQKGNPWNIGIEAPSLKEPKVNNSLIVSNLAIATSGNYRNFFIKEGVRYSHTINPITGTPIKHQLASVTVLEQSAMLADAYATAFMVMGEHAAKLFIEKYNLRANLIIKNKDSFTTWQNIDPVKIKFSAQKCQKQEGCVYSH